MLRRVIGQIFGPTNYMPLPTADKLREKTRDIALQTLAAQQEEEQILKQAISPRLAKQSGEQGKRLDKAAK
jgi:hypothetical protein